MATAQEPVIEALEAGGAEVIGGGAERAERDIHPRQRATDGSARRNRRGAEARAEPRSGTSRWTTSAMF